MLHSDDRQKFRDLEARLLATGDPYELDFRIIRGDGEERIFHETGSAIWNESGRPVRAFGATQDVTEQRRNEAALREREHLLRQGARIGRFGTWVWDVSEDRCLVCSEELAALFGMSVEEFLRERGSDHQIRIDPLRQGIFPAEDESFPEDGLSFEEEFRALTKHGEERWFREVGQTYRNPVTGRLWSVGVTQDVTDTKNAEAELRRLVDESARLAQLAEQSSRAKSEFLATMSHELRTPLNAIIGFSELLMTFGTNLDRGKQDEYHGIVLQSSRHLLSLINDILDLAKVESGKLELRLEAVSLKALADECVSYLAPAMQPKALAIEIDIPEIDFESDRRLLKQLLLNILSNAVKFNRDGGQVTIMARHFPGDDDVTISIEDTGIGMTPEEVERALLPFTQVENTYSRTQEGTGLGLTLAQRFTAIFSGEFEIASSKGVGTVITIRLPRRQHHPEHAVAQA